MSVAPQGSDMEGRVAVTRSGIDTEPLGFSARKQNVCRAVQELFQSLAVFHEEAE